MILGYLNRVNQLSKQLLLRELQDMESMLEMVV
nr:MAG TPA: hypothetical protein [Caudoviricetes sp.]